MKRFLVLGSILLIVVGVLWIDFVKNPVTIEPTDASTTTSQTLTELQIARAAYLKQQAAENRKAEEAEIKRGAKAFDAFLETLEDDDSVSAIKNGLIRKGYHLQPVRHPTKCYLGETDVVKNFEEYWQKQGAEVLYQSGRLMSDVDKIGKMDVIEVIHFKLIDQ